MTWHHQSEDVWNGPTSEIPCDDSPTVITTMWNPDDGVRIALDTRDNLLTPEQAIETAKALIAFANLQAPNQERSHP